MERSSISYEAGDKVAIVVEGNIFKIGIIKEFQGDVAIVETPTSVVSCSYIYLEHYNETNNEQQD